MQGNTDFRNYSTKQINEIFKDNGFNEKVINNFFKAFNSQQISNLKELKGIKQINKLSELMQFKPIELVKSLKDSFKNEKFVFKTADGHLIESVLMPDKQNISICVSVQAGCRFGCSFCNTGKSGLSRNLLANEILDQVRQINTLRIIPKRLTCVSFMGMGEPFDNLENCMLAMEWINSNYGYKISREKNTFSTSGCLPFDDFFSYKQLPNLALSLHFAFEDKRKKFMKNAKIPMQKLKEYMIEYNKITKKQVSIEYCLLESINDSEEDAVELIKFLQGVKAKINLLNYNKTENPYFKPVEESKVIEFKNCIKKTGVPILYRKSLGASINAGCGQLGGNG